MNSIANDFRAAAKDKYLKWILLLAAFFIFPFLSRVDITGDGAVYSARAIGKLDFMFADAQSTPLQWFDQMPWWAGLSYHDMPPVVLFIQHLFLQIHESIFFAKLPFALMGLGTIFFTYLWVKNLYDERLAGLTSFFLAINALFIWLTRFPRLEMGVIFFGSIFLYFLTLFLENKKYWPAFGVSIGLLLLTKYTAIFFVPAVIFYVAFQKRESFRSRELYFAGVTAFLFTFIIIIYNLMMYRATGHFDLQISRLLGQNSPWHLAGASGSFFANLSAIFFSIGRSISFPYIFFVLAGIVWSVFLGRKYLLPMLCLLFLTIEYAFSGADGHFLAVYTPFVAFFTAVFWQEARVHWPRHDRLLKFAIGAMGLYLIFFATLTHTFASSNIGRVGWGHGLMSSAVSYGMYELDSYLDNLLIQNKVDNRVDFYRDLKNKDTRLAKYLLPSSSPPSLSNVIVYDQNIDWFSRVWLFERRRFYHNLPIISTVEFARLPDSIKDGIKDAYFIRATEFANLDSAEFRNELFDSLEKYFAEKNIHPDLLRRRDGQVAFKIYHSVVR
ncbi:MAG: glycosyltransferase family 39 protein [Patescibacteria group bacterium]